MLNTYMWTKLVFYLTDVVSRSLYLMMNIFMVFITIENSYQYTNRKCVRRILKWFYLPNFISNPINIMLVLLKIEVMVMVMVVLNEVMRIPNGMPDRKFIWEWMCEWRRQNATHTSPSTIHIDRHLQQLTHIYAYMYVYIYFS